MDEGSSGLRRVLDAFSRIVDIILPRSERRMRTEMLEADDLPSSPESHGCGSVRITTLAPYRERVIEDLIWSLKYENSSRAASLAASLLSDFLPEEVDDIRRWWARPILLVPIPLHPARLLERGFNQSERVLLQLPEEYRDGTIARFAPHVLTRVRETRQQARLSKHERLANVEGAFEATQEVSGMHVILFDDVATTGATLAAAATALEQKGASVSPIALARA